MANLLATKHLYCELSSFKYNFLFLRNHDYLEKWLILGLGQEISKMILEHLVMAQGKKAIKDVSMLCQRNSGANSKRSFSWLNSLD